MNTPGKIIYRNRGFLILFIAIFLLCLYVLGENPLEQFTPKRTVVKDMTMKLINLFTFAEGILFVAYLSIGINLIYVYKEFKKFRLPWEGYLWIYAAFILVGALARLTAFLDMFLSYYWIEGFIKMLSAIISSTVAIAFYLDSKKIRSLKTPTEYGRLADAYEELLKEYNEIVKEKK